MFAYVREHGSRTCCVCVCLRFVCESRTGRGSCSRTALFANCLFVFVCQARSHELAGVITADSPCMEFRCTASFLQVSRSSVPCPGDAALAHVWPLTSARLVTSRCFLLDWSLVRASPQHSTQPSVSQAHFARGCSHRGCFFLQISEPRWRVS